MSLGDVNMVRRMISMIAILVAGVLITSRKEWCYPLGLACLMVGIVVMP